MVLQRCVAVPNEVHAFPKKHFVLDMQGIPYLNAETPQRKERSAMIPQQRLKTNCMVDFNFLCNGKF
jgi:hypothetical protein